MKKKYFLLLVSLMFVSYSFSQQFISSSNSAEFTPPQRNSNVVIWDQQVGAGIDGIVSDYFTGIPGGVYSADDFQLTSNTKIETITAYGFQNNMTLETLITGFDVYIYTDNAGMPSSDPSSPGTGVFELINFDSSDPALTITNDGAEGYTFSLDVTAANGSDVILSSGIYWLVISPRMNMSDSDGNNRWNWFEAFGVSNLSGGMLVDPDGIFGGLPWTLMTDLGTTFDALAFTIDGDDSLSIDEFEISKVNVSPNPTNDFVNIELHPSNTIDAVELYNTIGQLVYKGINKTQLDISKLNSGVYIMKLYTKNGELTKRVVKN